MTQQQVRVTLRTRPKQAIQWKGGHHAAEQIARALNGRVIVWPVPRGYEHWLRKESERDRSRDDVLDTAEPFLVVYRSETDDDPLRVPSLWWFVWDDDDVEILSPADFDRAYALEGAGS